MVTVTSGLLRWVSILTVFFGVPLYLTKLIHENRFPEGMPFVFMYTWGLISVVVLPILLLLQLYLLLRGFRGGERGLLLIGTLALCFGVVAECVFLLTRR